MVNQPEAPGVVVCTGGIAARVAAQDTGKARSPAPSIDTATAVQRLIARKPTSQIHIQLSVQVTGGRIDADRLDPTGRRSDSWHGFDRA